MAATRCVHQGVQLGRSRAAAPPGPRGGAAPTRPPLRHRTAGVVWQLRLPKHIGQPAHLLQHRHLRREPADRVRFSAVCPALRCRSAERPLRPGCLPESAPAPPTARPCPALRSMWVNLILGLVIYLGFVAFRGMKGFEFYHARLVRRRCRRRLGGGWPPGRRWRPSAAVRSCSWVHTHPLRTCCRRQLRLCCCHHPLLPAAAASGVAQAAAAAPARPPAAVGLAATGVQGDG